MARVKGGYLGGIYDVPKKQPLDSRMLVTKRVDLINPSVWKTNGSTTGELGHYNGMIVAVNSDGVYNGIYYLTDRSAITDENYAAYKDALAAGEDVESYFLMWTKLGTLNDLATLEEKIEDMMAEVKPSANLVPVDGTIAITHTDNGDSAIGVAIAPATNNALVAVEGGLFVPTYTAGNGIEIVDNHISVKLADTTHGLVAVDGALSLNLATKDFDGAMSKEDKVFIDELKELDAPNKYATKDAVQEIKESVARVEQSLIWAEI